MEDCVDCNCKLFLRKEKKPIYQWSIMILLGKLKTFADLKSLLRNKTKDICSTYNATDVDFRSLSVIRLRHKEKGKTVDGKTYNIGDDGDWGVLKKRLRAKSNIYELEVHISEYTYKAPNTIRIAKGGRKPGKGEKKKADEQLEAAILQEKEIERRLHQEDKWKELQEVVRETYDGSEALNELWIKCSICSEEKKLNHIRYYKHFKGHWGRCLKKKKLAEDKEAKAAKNQKGTIPVYFTAMEERAKAAEAETKPVEESESESEPSEQSELESEEEAIQQPIKKRKLIDYTDDSSSNLSDYSDNDEYEHGDSTKESPWTSSSSESEDDKLSTNPRAASWVKDLHPTAIKLQKVIQQGLPDDHMFHIIVNSVCDFALNAERPEAQFQWDPRYREFVTSLTHVGGHAAFNLWRGTGGLGQGIGGKFEFKWNEWNIPCPSERNMRLHQPPAITESGILKDMLLNFHELTKDSSPLHEDETCRIIPVSIARDGMQLKPGGMVDISTGQIIGLTEKIDVAYVKANPSPDPEDLKSKFKHEANALFVTTLDNKSSLLVGNEFTAKGLTGQDVFDQMCSSVKIVQTCGSCLKKTVAKGGIISEAISTCCSECNECKENEELTPCQSCENKGHKYGHPALRACSNCIEKAEKCTKVWVAVWASDCEQVYKTAMELFNEAKIGGTIDTDLELLHVCPEMVHVCKRLHGSLSNWFLYIEGDRGNTVFLRALRNDPGERLRATIRKLLSASCLYRKDRMDFSGIIQICQSKVLKELEGIQRIIVTLAPERYQLWRGNEKGILKTPIDVCVGPYGTILALDNAGSLYKARLHYPVDLIMVTDKLIRPTSVYFMDGIAYICEPSTGNIIYVDLVSKLKLNPMSMKKEDLIKKCCELKLVPSEAYAKTQLRRELQPLLKEWLKRQEENHQNKSVLMLTGDKLSAPLSVSGVNGSLLVGDTGNHSVSMVVISQVGVKLGGQVTCVIKLPTSSIPMGLSPSSCGRRIYVADSDQNGGIYQCDISTATHVRLVSNGTEHCSTIHGVVLLDDTNLIFTDRDSNQVKMLHISENRIIHISGSGKCEDADGTDVSGGHAQPTGVCLENQTIYTADSAGPSIRMIARIKGFRSYLTQLKKGFETFSIHDSQVVDESHEHQLDEAVEQMSQIVGFFHNLVSSIREVTGKPNLKPQGPEGSAAYKTIESIEMITRSLTDLRDLLQKTNPEYIQSIKLLSLMTLVVEHHFSSMRSRYPMPYVLQYGQQLLPTVKETLKCLTLTSFKYFTRRNSYYPVPESAVPFEKMRFPKKVSGLQLKSEDKDLLSEWRRQYGSGVRQQTVRQKSTMFSPGTLPLDCYKQPTPATTPSPAISQLLDFLTPTTTKKKARILHGSQSLVALDPSMFTNEGRNFENVVLGYIRDSVVDNAIEKHLENVELLTMDPNEPYTFRTADVITVPKEAVFANVADADILAKHQESNGPLTVQISARCFSQLLGIHNGNESEDVTADTEDSDQAVEEVRRYTMDNYTAPASISSRGRRTGWREQRFGYD